MQNAKYFKKIIYSLAVLILLTFGAYYYMYEDIRSKNENISSLVQDLDFESSRQEYLLSTERMIESIAADIEHIDASIIAAEGDVQFIESLESIAQKNGLTIAIDSLLIEDDKSFPGDTITTLKIRAKTKGGWVGTYGFLAQIESLPFKIKLNRFAIANNADGESADGTPVSNNWQSSFEITVLKYK